MPVRYTSRLALVSELGRLSASRFRVYKCVSLWPGEQGPTIEDIAIGTGMKESSVSGRVNELKKAGILIEGPLKTNRSGKQAMTYIAMGYMEEEYLHQHETEPQLSLF